MAAERLHKVMANAGIASRRECEAMIAAGRVSVNDKVVTEMGVKVDPDRDHIRVDGEPLKPRTRSKLVYLMLYKPAGYLSVFDDERGRPGLEALVTSETRLYPVGRLDADSEGLQLLTNDGELTLRLSHPRYEHAKTYLVLVDHVPSAETLAHFRRGIELEDGKTLPSEWRVLQKPPTVAPPSDPSQAQGVWLQVTLREGRKRQIRRMAAAEKLGVRRLIRIAMGPLRLDRKLRPGQSRHLTGDELRLLSAPPADRSGRSPRRSPAEPSAGSRTSAPRRSVGASGTRLPAERAAKPDRRPPSGRSVEPGRSQPAADRPVETGRQPAQRDTGAQRAPSSPGRDGRYDRVDRSDRPNRRQGPAGRSGAQGRRPPNESAPGSDRRPSGKREGASDQQRASAGSGSPQRPRRSGGQGEGDSERRQRSDRSERPGPAADRAGRPRGGQSPLRFRRPSRQGSQAQSDSSDREPRGGHGRPRQQSGGPSSRRPQAGQPKPRTGGAPKRRKP